MFSTLNIVVISAYLLFVYVGKINGWNNSVELPNDLNVARFLDFSSLRVILLGPSNMFPTQESVVFTGEVLHFQGLSDEKECFAPSTVKQFQPWSPSSRAELPSWLTGNELQVARPSAFRVETVPKALDQLPCVPQKYYSFPRVPWQQRAWAVLPYESRVPRAQGAQS